MAAVALFFECVQLSLQGVFRGIGKQLFAFYMIVVSFYIIGLPLAYLIGIYWGMGLDGLWIGLAIGVSVLALSYIYLCKFYFNWQKIADDAWERSERDLNSLKTLDMDNKVKSQKKIQTEEKIRRESLKEKILHPEP